LRIFERGSKNTQRERRKRDIESKDREWKVVDQRKTEEEGGKRNTEREKEKKGKKESKGNKERQRKRTEEKGE
jgi:hypothetical protein